MPAMSTSRPPRRGVPPSVAAAFALAFAFAASAVFVAVEAAPMEGLHSPSHSMEDCPSYGCVLLPRDVAFDEHAKAALESIRALATVAAAAADEDAEESAEGGGDAEEGNEGEEEANDEASDEHKGYASSAAAAFEGLVSAGNDEAATLTLVGYKGGTMESQINQDRSFVLSPYVLTGSNPQEGESATTTNKARLLGVFDGHAKLGELVSQYSVEELPGLLASKLGALDGGVDDSDASIEDEVKKVLVETFVEVDKSAPAQDGGGCTASVVLQLDHDVYLANAGDSRSFLAAYIPPPADSEPEKSAADGDNGDDDDEGEVGTVQVLYATREDKPHLPDEKERIESMGGTVMVPPPERLAAGATSRVMYVDPATGGQYGLAMSRSIGDWEVGRYGVVPTPIVEKFNLGEMAEEAARQAAEMACAPPEAAEAEVDESGEPVISSTTENKGQCSSEPIDPSSVQLFAVSATDGLLDYVPLDLIAQHVARGLYGPSELHPLTACEDLVATAAGGWHQAKGGRYRDDIAIAVSRLDLERR